MFALLISRSLYSEDFTPYIQLKDSLSLSAKTVRDLYPTIKMLHTTWYSNECYRQFINVVASYWILKVKMTPQNIQ